MSRRPPWRGRSERRGLRPADLAIAAGLLVALAVPVVYHLSPPEQVSGAAEAIDGDSLRVGGREVRLYGIDAPELAQTCERGGQRWPCGEAARRHLAGLVAGRALDCTVRTRDRYGRAVAECRAGTQALSPRMVADGYALAYGAFTAEEAAARAERRGVWAGSFEPPAAWRAAHPRAQ